jgi:hypothetical protein
VSTKSIDFLVWGPEFSNLPFGTTMPIPTKSLRELQEAGSLLHVMCAFKNECIKREVVRREKQTKRRTIQKRKSQMQVSLLHFSRNTSSQAARQAIPTTL